MDGEEAQVGTDVLREGTTLLRGQYTITGFLSAGGFGITYRARDSLDREVVLKECFPSAMCYRTNNTVQVRSQGNVAEFEKVVRQFGTEARRLARLKHPNIVGVHQVFEDNRTAYIALDFVRGHDLLEIIDRQAPPLPPEAVKSHLLQLLDAIDYVHGQDILHRDISPDNILIDDSGRPVLIDFGAAREEAIRTSRALSMLHTVKDGYSPYEFYVIGTPQDPSSDLYALAATFYHLISGKAPPDSQSRVAAAAEGRADPFVPLSDMKVPYDRHFVGALNQALALFPKDRLHSAREWIDRIDADRRRAAALEKARSDRHVEAKILRIVTETNEAVQADRQTEAERAAAEALRAQEEALRNHHKRRIRRAVAQRGEGEAGGPIVLTGPRPRRRRGLLARLGALLRRLRPGGGAGVSSGPENPDPMPRGRM